MPVRHATLLLARATHTITDDLEDGVGEQGLRELSVDAALRVIASQATYAADLQTARPAPARMKHVESLARGGFLEDEDVARIFPDGKVPDSAWDVLRGFVPQDLLQRVSLPATRPRRLERSR